MYKTSRTENRQKVVVGLVLAIVFGCTTHALAAGPTRDEYVSELERVCKPGAEATQRAMKGARADISAERLGVAAGKFAQAAQIFGSTVHKIAKVSRPPADTAKLTKWFGFLNRQELYLRQITVELRAGHSVRAQRRVARFIHNGNLANHVVLDFGFHYCSFKFSRYG
jgi:hypothetical protein